MQESYWLLSTGSITFNIEGDGLQFHLVSYFGEGASKESWPNLRCYLGICPYGLKKIKENRDVKRFAI
jgi:hypothetical protein